MEGEAYRPLVEEAPDGVLIHAEGRILFASARLLRMMAASSPDGLVGKPVMDFIHPDDREEVIRRGKEAAKGPVPPAEFRLRRLDGTLFPVETTAAPTLFAGRPALHVSVRDISARARVLVDEAHLRVARDLVRRMLHLLGERGPRSSMRRELGRALALETSAANASDHLWAFAMMGTGRLRLVEQDGRRFVLEGEDLLDVEPGDAQPSCQLALGYAEGMVEHLTGAPALGNEMQCQSQGHPCCRFVVKARDA